MKDLDELLKQITALPFENQRRVSAFLGAIVADVATLPLHWVYDQDLLKETISGVEELEFWPENKNPYYTIPTGQPSSYADTALICLKSLTQTQGVLNMGHLYQMFKEHFGEGSEYAAGLGLREAAKLSGAVGPIKGPWIHKAMVLFLENYESDKVDPECREFDIFSAVLPIICKYAGQPNLWCEAQKLVCHLTKNTAALEMLHTAVMLVNEAIVSEDDPISNMTKSAESLYPDVFQLINEVEEARTLPFISTVATFGKACYFPGAFQGALLAIFRESSFVDAIRLNITAGGSSCGRANLIGAYFGAKEGISGIPYEWLRKVKYIENIVQMALHVFCPPS